MISRKSVSIFILIHFLLLTGRVARVESEDALKGKSRIDIQIQLYQEKISQDPQQIHNYYALATNYIRKARETGDITYYLLAETTLQRALEIKKEDYEALKYLATVYLSKHQFQEALTLARKLNEMHPEDYLNYGTLGDALVELGEYDKADEVIQKMLKLKPGLVSYSRASYLRELRGDIEGAIQWMELAVRTANPRETEAVAWCLTQLGNLHFNKGDLAKAETQYIKALTIFPRYHYALAGRGGVEAAKKNYPQAVDWYKQAIQIIPLPEFITALGDVYQKMGDPHEARKQYDLVEYMGLLNKINQVVYNRDLALFYADHDLKLTEALELARKELEFRKDNIYTQDTLAWACYKNQQFQEALKASALSLRLGTQDARLFFHAGMIYYKLGEKDKAAEYLNKALTLNPYFHILYAEVAEKTLAEIKGR
ncbi:MAG TPA: tetratricopeptide repeat protein [Candidatus Limnocylindrales bacterium]|nr:tetratricopeptide repeat protein [Candidatus Limnocylindrales bacterium]